jgi:hypothetical protein
VLLFVSDLHHFFGTPFCPDCLYGGESGLPRGQ